MSKKWTEQILDSQITELCSEYSELFKRVRRRTRSNVQAWVVVQNLIGDYPPKKASGNDCGRIGKDQLERLRGLGVRGLKDLTPQQADVLIDCVKTERKYGEL